MVVLLAALVTGGFAGAAAAQTAQPKSQPAKTQPSKAAKPAAKAAPAKSSKAAAPAKPPASGNAEPSLIGQFGTWGACRDTER